MPYKQRTLPPSITSQLQVNTVRSPRIMKLSMRVLLVACTALMFVSEGEAACATACLNGGTKTGGNCTCAAGWTGNCCNVDIDECAGGSSPCAHICTNSPGSFSCSCASCYTKSGNNCLLNQCKIGGAGTCYAYGAVNPNNPCQECNSANKVAWTNNNALSCSDGDLCTKNDACNAGTCSGTRFYCKHCQGCNGVECATNATWRINTKGFCELSTFCTGKSVGGYYSDPQSDSVGSCNRYYHCGTSSYSNILQCPGTLRWSETRNCCMWPSQVSCPRSSVDKFCVGKPSGNYPHASACKFIMCCGGVTYNMDCAANTGYNATSGNCDLPSC